MFSDDITTSDAFLDMPNESQLLYFHLGMNADDDGFIGSPKMIMRHIGAADDTYRLLVIKKFILHFERGICVVKHWRINNQIRKDRYTETKYRLEKSQLYIKENGSYTMNPEKGIPMPSGHFITSVIAVQNTGNQLATTGRRSIGKDSIGKVRERGALGSMKYLSNIPSEDMKEFTMRFHTTDREIKSKGEDLKLYCQRKGKSYKDYKAFLLNALKRDFKEREASKSGKYGSL